VNGTARGQRQILETYDPSGRFDSGITRSRVRGSTAMPAVVFSGLRGGLDIGYNSESWRGGVSNNFI
jgi:hypothetical protein